MLNWLACPFSYEDFKAQIAQILRQYTHPTRLNSLLVQAEERLTKSDHAAAAAMFAEALTLKDTSARALVGIARVHHATGDQAAAKASLKRATDVNPDYIESYRLSLEIAESESDRAAIIQSASILNSLSPENPRYMLILARTYLELSHLEASEKFFRKAILLSPRMAEAYKGLGNVYLAKEDYDRAMRNFKKALDLDESDISTLNSLGTAYIRLGQYKEGIERYLVALKLNPHNAAVLFNLGHAYEKRRDLEKSKWYYAQALIHKAGFEKAARGLERVEKAVRDGETSAPLTPPPTILKRSS